MNIFICGFLLAFTVVPVCYGTNYLRKDSLPTCLSGRHRDLKIGEKCPYFDCPCKGMIVADFENKSGLFVHRHAGSGDWYTQDGEIHRKN